MISRVNRLKRFYKQVILWTPTLFKRIIYLGITVGAIGGGVLLSKDKFPAWMVNLSDYMVVIGLTCSIIAKYALRKSKAIKEK